MIKPFVETLKLASHYRPASIGTPMVFGAMEIAGTAMMSGKKSPAQAMKEANASVQVELTRLLKRVK